MLDIKVNKWIKKEACASEKMLRTVRKRNNRRTCSVILLIFAIFIVLGIAAGVYQNVFIFIYFTVSLITLISIVTFLHYRENRSICIDSIEKAYRSGAMREFETDSVKKIKLFCNQMDQGRYKSFEYEQNQLPFLAKVIIGPDYMVYRNHVTSTFTRCAIISTIYMSDYDAKVSYIKSGQRLRKEIIAGTELIIKNKNNKNIGKMYFDNKTQAKSVIALLNKYCPHVEVNM
ncbi:MAG: hypothetical protein ACK5LL_10140 [Suipraeoptans sp.]